MQTPIDQIIIDPARRQRSALDQRHVATLADSLTRIGLLHPIAVEETAEGFLLISGEHRLEAARSLGWTHIDAKCREDMTEGERIAIALEENIKRLDATWPEQVRAVHVYHEMHCCEMPDWTMEKTGEALGLSRHHIGRMLSVAEHIDNPTIANALTLSSAFNFVEREKQRKEANETEQILSSINFDAPREPTPAPTKAPIVNADLFEWVETYNGPRFSFLHCDFPYGIDFDKAKGMRKSVSDRYEDSETTLVDLLDLMPQLPVAAVAHLIFWFSPKHYERVKLALTKQGWRVDPYPLVWHKNDNSGIIRDQKRTGRNTYEMAFFASKGDRYIVKSVGTSTVGPQPRTGHASEKNVDVLEHFFRMVVDQHTTMLDPTCGSGTALIAANRLGASHVLGVEKDPEFYALARDRWLTSQTG